VSVKIDIPPFLQHLANGVEVTNVSGSTVGECLNNFVVKFPRTKKILFDKYNKLLEYIDIYINGESTYPEELNRRVNDGDELFIMAVIVGG